MKRVIRSATKIRKFENKRNPNKKLEVHEDGYGHRSAKQYMEWPSTGVKNPTGDGNFHRWRKQNMNELLEDYNEINHTFEIRVMFEIDPGHDVAGPQVAEEFFTIEAPDGRTAIQQARKEWGKPYERIDVVAIDPEETEEDLPYASTNIDAADEPKGYTYNDMYIHYAPFGVAVYDRGKKIGEFDTEEDAEDFIDEFKGE